MKVDATHKLLFLLGIIFLFYGCKQPERTIVGDDPATIPADTTTEQTSGEFWSLTIGELYPINTLDPLLADNPASIRAVQLLYEGLVRFDSTGKIQPALATEWSISKDSLKYTFQLDNEIYYHDSDAFSTGTGRRLVADDVKWAFERMTRVDVPPFAAQLFMKIRGFEPFFQEQRHVYHASQRTMDEIPGISVSDDNTVIFDLEERDPHFLEKLAMPHAVIYPREAVGSTAEDFKTVGTGPFYLARQGSDSSTILTKFRNHPKADEIHLNRVAIVSSSSESDLLLKLEEGDIHLLPDIGPKIMQNLFNGMGQIKSSFAENYSLSDAGGRKTYVFYQNPSVNLSPEVVGDIKSLVNSDLFFTDLPDNTISVTVTDTGVSDTSKPDISDHTNKLNSTFSNDPFIRTLLTEFSKHFSSEGYSFKMTDFRVPTKDIAFVIGEQSNFGTTDQWTDFVPLFRVTIPSTALMRTEIDGQLFNTHPWWINLFGVKVPFEN
jgi:ABC-type transport system substrate-binding protein